MLTLILAESALETVPQELWRQPAVKRSSERRRKQSKFIILDRSLHHSAMKTLKDGEKRGRPDIVHLSLLEALGSPLNKECLLKVYVHTFNDYVISVSSQTRLPRNYNRFIGLMEQLFEYGRAPPRGMPLLTMEKRSFSGLVEIIKPTYIIAFSRIGKPAILDETISNLINEENLLAIVGGFPSGHFTEAIQSLADEVLCIDPEMLEAWTIVSRLIYEYERAFTLPRKRIEMIREK